MANPPDPYDCPGPEPIANIQRRQPATQLQEMELGLAHQPLVA